MSVCRRVAIKLVMNVWLDLLIRIKVTHQLYDVRILAEVLSLGLIKINLEYVGSDIHFLFAQGQK